MILTGHDQEITQWVCKQLGCRTLGDTAAIGFLDNDKLIGGVVYHNFRYPNMELSIATISPKWCTRSNIKAVFNYPFKYYDLNRVTAIIDTANSKAIKLVEKIGFVKEGVIRKNSNRGDAYLYGMLKEECKWL